MNMGKKAQEEVSLQWSNSSHSLPGEIIGQKKTSEMDKMEITTCLMSSCKYSTSIVLHGKDMGLVLLLPGVCTFLCVCYIRITDCLM